MQLMTDLSSIKLKDTHFTPEELFKFLDHSYCVWDLRVQQGWMGSGLMKRRTQKFLAKHNASNRSLYPLFIEWWRENGTIYRATTTCEQGLVQDQGLIVQ